MAIPTCDWLAVATNSGASASAVGNKPTGTIEATVLLAYVIYVNTTTLNTAPTGWVQIGTEVDGGALGKCSLWYLVVTNAHLATASWTWTLNASVNFAVYVNAYTNVDLVNPIQSSAQATPNVGSTTINAPSVTTSQPNTRVVYMYAGSAGGTWTEARGTERVDTLGEAWADELIASPVATGTNLGTTTSGSNMAFTVALGPGRAERFWLAASGSQPVTVTADASWEQTTGALLAPLNAVKGVSTIGTTTITEPANTTANQDYLRGQFISIPLAPQTISGAFKAQIRSRESAAGANGAAQVILRVVSRDGTTVRGTLYAGDNEVLTGNPANEFSTTLTNRRHPRIATTRSLTAVVALDGDRLVVEIGVREHNTSSTAFTYDASFGESAGTDMAEDDTTTTANDPWIEFSSGIQFQDTAFLTPFPAPSPQHFTPSWVIVT
jgi:hypothetical protein